MWSRQHHHVGLLIAVSPAALVIAFYAMYRKRELDGGGVGVARVAKKLAGKRGGATQNPRSKKGKQRVATSEASAEMAARKRSVYMEKDEDEDEDEDEDVEDEEEEGSTDDSSAAEEEEVGRRGGGAKMARIKAKEAEIRAKEARLNAKLAEIEAKEARLKANDTEPGEILGPPHLGCG